MTSTNADFQNQMNQLGRDDKDLQNQINQLNNNLKFQVNHLNQDVTATDARLQKTIKRLSQGVTTTDTNLQNQITQLSRDVASTDTDFQTQINELKTNLHFQINQLIAAVEQVNADIKLHHPISGGTLSCLMNVASLISVSLGYFSIIKQE